MAKKRPKFNQEMSIRGANRRLFARSPLVREKLEESRQEFPRYKNDGTRHKKNWVKRECEVCGNWVPSSQIAIDHIDPVVPPEGFPVHFDMWDRITLFLKRLWCDKSNLQRICDPCHNSKTKAERVARYHIQYNEELDILEQRIKSHIAAPAVMAHLLKSTKKELSKYTAKKKTVDFPSVVQRALRLKEILNK